MQLVKIPTDRIKSLIGKDGKTKKEIEERGKVKLSIDEEGNVKIYSEDIIAEWKVIDVIKAIGRGFSVEVAMKLFDEEYVLRIIDLKEIFSKEKQRERYKARVIGTKGKAKKTIEEISGAYVSVHGNTVSVIGKLDEVTLAERAVRMLLGGASHSNVYFMLQKERQKRQEEGGWM